MNNNNNWYRNRSLFSQPNKPKPPRKKWRVRHVIVGALKRMCMAIGAMVLLSATMSLIFSNMLMREMEAPTLPSEMVLYLKLDEGMVEHQDAASRYGFGDSKLAIRKVIDAIDYAAKDKRVKGLVTKIEGAELNLAHLEELRAALLRFRQSGKFAYVYANSYGTVGQYMLASAHDEIWMQPMGIISIPGVMIEMPYAREVLDKIGVQPQVFAREQYKNFFESFTSMEMSEPSRLMMASILEDIATRTTAGIGEARNMEPAQVKALVDQALFTDEEALEAKLIDRLDYSDTFNAYIKEKVTGKPDSDEKIFASVGAYIKDVAERKQLTGGKKPKVALIYVVGQLVDYDDGSNALSAGNKLVSYISDVVDNGEFDTIVLRVDSPGGSPVAAEAIRRAVVKAKEAGLKVVVSMGASAASGGYWIATDADRIFALPSTLTGSIGVTGGKFSLQEMWDKVGVNWDGLSWGENAGIWSFNRPYTPSEAAQMDALMDNIYSGFLVRVAEGRGMSVEEVRAIAGGRVWTGAQAVGIGLVDELGGLDRTLDYVAAEHGLAGRSDLRVVAMPAPKTALERIVELFEGQVRVSAFMKSHAGTLATLGDMLDRMQTQTAPSGGFSATAPELGLGQ